MTRSLIKEAVPGAPSIPAHIARSQILVARAFG